MNLWRERPLTALCMSCIASRSSPVSGDLERSRVVGTEASPEGERLLRYQSGLMFPQVPVKQHTILMQALEEAASGAPLEGRPVAGKGVGVPLTGVIKEYSSAVELMAFAPIDRIGCDGALTA